MEYAKDTPAMEINVADVRSLLRDAFNAGDLRRFCEDHPALGSITRHFGLKDSFEEMIGIVVEQCRTQALLLDLLMAIRKHNPRQSAKYLAQVYDTAGRAYEAHNWTQAIGLYRQIVKIDKCHGDASKKLAEAENRLKLEQLYDEAERAYEAHDWTQAIGLYREILKIDGHYKDAAQKLAEATDQEHLEQFYAEAERACEVHDWTQAIGLYREILKVDGHYKDAAQKLAEATDQEHLEQCYAEAERAYKARDWREVVSRCQKIISIAPYYRDTRHLLWKARFHSATQCPGVVWSRHKRIVIALSALCLLVVVLVIAVAALFRHTPPTTPTPSTPSVNVEGFFVAGEGEPALAIMPGDTITVKTQEIVDIEAKISAVNREKDLVFTWYTCKTGDNLERRQIDNPKWYYVAPSEPGKDCITACVEKGGVRLDKKTLFVDVQN
jgi:tetratricopeptide (TPR) repeat protein